MASPFLGEIRIMSFPFAPKGWALCNGQVLGISQNQALFALLGTTYGGNGVQNFALPNLQGRTPIHSGNGFARGQIGGEQDHTLITTEMPGHNHTLNATAVAANTDTPASNAVLAQAAISQYRPQIGSTVRMDPGIIGGVGGQPHSNMQPYLGINFCIALAGIFPSRS